MRPLGNPLTVISPFLLFILILSDRSFAEEVKIGSYYPSPYGSYKHLNIEDGATDPESYGSLQIVREETEHLGSHLAFIRGGTTSRMSLGYKQSSDAFGFGPAVTGAFDPTDLSISPDGNLGIGTSAPTGAASPAGGATTGNLDVNDVYLRSSARWASSNTRGGFIPPRASGSYTGNSGTVSGERIILTNSGTPAVGFQPRRVVIWFWQNPSIDDEITIYETFEGMVVEVGKNADYSFRYAKKADFSKTYLKIVAGDNGFTVRGSNESTSNNQGTIYYWMAWD